MSRIYNENTASRTYNDSPYFRCPDEERFYPFEILALRTVKVQLFRVVVFTFKVDMKRKFLFSHMKVHEKQERTLLTVF